MTDSAKTPYPTASYMKINGGTIARTVEFSDGVMVDLDSEGAIVGIEVIGSMPMSLVAWHIIREIRLPANPPQPTAENAPYPGGDVTQPEGMEVARIVITRVLSDDGQDGVWCEATDQSGEPLALVESLGMLRMTEDTLIRAAMGETPDD